MAHLRAGANRETRSPSSVYMHVCIHIYIHTYVIFIDLSINLSIYLSIFISVADLSGCGCAGVNRETRGPSSDKALPQVNRRPPLSGETGDETGTPTPIPRAYGPRGGGAFSRESHPCTALPTPRSGASWGGVENVKVEVKGPVAKHASTVPTGVPHS